MLLSFDQLASSRHDSGVRRFGWLFTLSMLFGMSRYSITRLRFSFSGAGDNLLLRDYFDRGGLDWPGCISVGRFRPATYCDLVLQFRSGLFNNPTVEALVFSLTLSTCVVVGWQICEVLIGQPFISRKNTTFIIPSIGLICFSPVWSYSLTSDYANMEMFGNMFFLLSILFQIRALSMRHCRALVWATLFALSATLWHERFIAALVGCCVVATLTLRPKSAIRDTRRMAATLSVIAPIALTVTYLAGRWLSSDAAVISYGGESATSLSSLVSVTAFGRMILAVGLSLSPVHFANYYYVDGGFQTPVLVAPAVFAAVSFCLYVVAPLIRSAVQPGRYGSVEARGALQTLLLNLGPLTLFLGSVEERSELRWFAVSSVLVIPVLTVGIARVWVSIPQRWKPLFPAVVLGAITIAGALEANIHHYLVVGDALKSAEWNYGSVTPICLSPEVPEGYFRWTTGYGLLGDFALVSEPPCFEVRFPRSG